MPSSDRSAPLEPAPIGPAEGLAVLHLFCTAGPDLDVQGVRSAVKAARQAGDQVVTVALLGRRADVGVMALGADQWRLRALQTGLQRAGLHIADSYVSLTEVSEYAQGMPEAAKRERLYPALPPEGKPAFCFYPMSKRRTAGANWYELPYDDRMALMRGHGVVGRRYHGRIVQVITGSTGLDDWEWGVTLFGRRPDDLKACVYEMRFDEASARFAEFGPFFTGVVADLDTVLAQALGA